jgi:hypothetical protein
MYVFAHGSSYPFHMEYRTSHPIIQALPITSVRWSILSPSGMSPLHKDGKCRDLIGPLGNSIVLGADQPPLCEPTWLGCIPFFGVYLDALKQFSGAFTTFEELADRLAEDVSQPDQGERWIGHAVGVKRVPGAKTKYVY